MSLLSLLGRLVRADFLERVRRHSFLVTLAITVFAAYMFLPPNPSKYATLNMGGHRGIYNSAWVGSLVAMLTGIFLSLAGFYLVKNAIERDRRTGVGQILAATPLRTSHYLLGKWASNLMVLAAMLAVIAVAAGVMQQVRGEEHRLDLLALLSPFVWVTLPVMAVVAALAVCFEVLPGLRGGFGNVVYFILWNVGLSLTVMRPRGSVDLLGSNVVFTQMQEACARVYPEYAVGGPFTMGFNIKAEGVWNLTTFVWSGTVWPPAELARRVLWVVVAVAFTLLAVFAFDRFDARAPIGPARAKPGRRAREKAPVAAATRGPSGAVSGPAAVAPLPALRLDALAGAAASGTRTRLGGLVVAELRIMLQGISRWWWLVVLGLTVASLLVPLVGVRQFVIPFALVWPLLCWSAMGTREQQYRTDALLFSAPRPVTRLLLAQWLAGAALAAMVAAGGLVRFALIADWMGAMALIGAVAFIPSMALASGVWTGSGKLFEVLYLWLWYVGPMNRIPLLDFSGATQPQAGIAPVARCLVAAAAFITLALVGRARQLAR